MRKYNLQVQGPWTKRNVVKIRNAQTRPFERRNRDPNVIFDRYPRGFVNAVEFTNALGSLLSARRKTFDVRGLQGWNETRGTPCHRFKFRRFAVEGATRRARSRISQNARQNSRGKCGFLRSVEKWDIWEAGDFLRETFCRSRGHRLACPRAHGQACKDEGMGFFFRRLVCVASLRGVIEYLTRRFFFLPCVVTPVVTRISYSQPWTVWFVETKLFVNI